MAKKAPAKKDDSQVEVEILQHGTPHGKPGDRVMVPHDIAKHLCAVRQRPRGGDQGYDEVRMAKPAGEVAPPIPLSSLSVGEAAALGIVNRVETPPDTILPKGQAGLPLPGDADFDDSLGVNQKPRVPGAKPKALTKKQKAAAKKARAAAAKAANADAEEESEEELEEGESEEGAEDAGEQESEGEEGEAAQT